MILFFVCVNYKTINESFAFGPSYIHILMKISQFSKEQLIVFLSPSRETHVQLTERGMIKESLLLCSPHEEL